MSVFTHSDVSRYAYFMAAVKGANYSISSLHKKKLCSLLLLIAQVSVLGIDYLEATEWSRRLRVQLLMQQKKEAEKMLPISRAPDLAQYSKEVVIPLLEVLTLMCNDYSSMVYQAKHTRQQVLSK
mmetsp:Transcript_32203/g.55655  ORF Transcript_32203/g.55655 Transcript_32203/m.55655 type:complete len:125 (+) Transcript_32203:713-1087(+)